MSCRDYLPPFDLELYFAQHEFTAKYLLGLSDAQTSTMSSIVALADEECKELWENLSLGYTETKGLPSLNSEILKIYRSCDKRHIHCFAGAEEGIFVAMTALLAPGDHCIVITPCYQSLRSIPERLGAEVGFCNLDENWNLNLQLLEGMIQPNTKLIVINFPNNPTGAMLTQIEMNDLVLLARRNSIWIFSDEVYRGLEYSEEEQLLPCATVYEKGISLGVMSKALGLAGLRIGWIVCTDTDFISKISNTKHYLSICNSGPSEVLALIALRNEAAILRRNREIILRNKRLFEEFLDSWKG